MKMLERTACAFVKLSQWIVVKLFGKWYEDSFIHNWLIMMFMVYAVMVSIGILIYGWPK